MAVVISILAVGFSIYHVLFTGCLENHILHATRAGSQVAVTTNLVA